MHTASKQAPARTDAVKGDALATLATLDHGHLGYKISEKLQELLTAVGATGKKGRLTLDLHIDPMPKLGPAAVQIAADLQRSKVPTASPDSQIRFSTPDGQLVCDDPRQLKLRFDNSDPNASA